MKSVFYVPSTDNGNKKNNNKGLNSDSLSAQLVLITHRNMLGAYSAVQHHLQATRMVHCSAIVESAAAVCYSISPRQRHWMMR